MASFSPSFSSALLALVAIDDNVARRRERGAERARKHRAKRKAAAAVKEERAKKQRIDDAAELASVHQIHQTSSIGSSCGAFFARPARTVEQSVLSVTL